jgi:hypothetical protein
MARKSEENLAPVVTSLPLPSSDSVLVIDLPDGQKLLVGKMNHGTVIEVATWRGTGRPDSRTNRLMLGMSSSESETPINSQESADDMVVDKRSIKYWIWLIIQLFNKARSILVLAVSEIKSLFSKKLTREKDSRSVDAIEDDVQAWLNNIKLNNSNPASGTTVGSPKGKPTTQRAISAPKKAKKGGAKSKSRPKA